MIGYRDESREPTNSRPWASKANGGISLLEAHGRRPVGIFHLLVIAVLCLVPIAGAAAAEPATIAVEPQKVLGALQPLVFGHNVEAADTQYIFSARSNPIMGQTGDGLWDPKARRPAPEVLAMSKEIGVAMLRYPGGCLTHNFNWKDAVEPLEKRPNFTFGVAEYLAWCRAAGAEPLMNVSAYVGGPAEAAELVEYLNAPATAGHPWAQKRAEWGRAEPYGVKYFEMGNESDHGNHDVKPFRKHTPESYAAWFNDCAKRMRAVDASIRIGAHMGTGTGPDDPWNRKVLQLTRGQVDFVIVHTYAVGLWDPKANSPIANQPDLLMRACMAAGEQVEQELRRYREVIRQAAGREIPLAITEYNAAFVQDKPMPYRFSYGAALFSADYLRILLQPETSCLMANYWHLVNGYWGMLRGPRVPGEREGRWRKMPAWWLFRLWRHFGTRLVDVQVASPRLAFEGCLGVHPARKDGGQGGDAGFVVTAEGGQAKGCRWRRTGERSLAVTLEKYAAETYHTLGRVEARGGATYELRHEGRLAGGEAVTATVGVDLIDARGWDATRSGAATHGVESAADWRTFRTKLVTLPDCKGLELHLRLIAKPGAAPASGRFEIRDLRVARLADPPPYAVLTASASLSQDARTLYLIVFNKHHAEGVTARVIVADGSARSARVWTVTAPSLTCTNLQREEVRETLSGEPVADVGPKGFSYTFPARSMTALEIARQ